MKSFDVVKLDRKDYEASIFVYPHGARARTISLYSLTGSLPLGALETNTNLLEGGGGSKDPALYRVSSCVFVRTHNLS